MLNLAQSGFTREQVILALHSPYRRIDFRYELQDKDGRKKKDLQTVMSGEVQHQAFATIKRTAKFKIREDNDIDYFTDRIKPFVRVNIPKGKVLARQNYFYSQQFAILSKVVEGAETEGWAEYPLGVFYLSSPERVEGNGVVIRDIEAYDGLIVLKDDKFSERYGFAAGTNYHQAITTILQGAGITKYNLEYTDKTLQRDIEFEAGTPKLNAVNELLGAINYDSIRCDVNGHYISGPYRSPSEKTPEYDYVTDGESVTFGGMKEKQDKFNVPNKWVATVSNPEQEPLTSIIENRNPNSPTSIDNMERTIVDFRKVDDIADQYSLDRYVKRIAEEDSQIYGKMEFQTAIMPHHDYMDALNVDFTELGIKDKFSETAWTMPLQTGGKMKHEVRRVVSID